MSSEIYWLTLTVIYSSLLFVPHTLYRMATTGPLKLLNNPVPGDEPFAVGWARRSNRAHMNALENLASFAPVILAIELTGASNETSVMAAQVYFWARVVHAPFCIVKTPAVRTIAYIVGMSATLTIAAKLLKIF